MSNFNEWYDKRFATMANAAHKLEMKEAYDFGHDDGQYETIEVVDIYEKALKDYACTTSWVRGTVYNKRSNSRWILYGYETATKALKEVEVLREGNK